MSLFESPWQAIQTKILKQWIDSAKTQKLFDASFFNFFFIVQSISQWIIIHLNGWYCAYFLPPRRNFTKHNALSKKARSRCCKFSIFGILLFLCSGANYSSLWKLIWMAKNGDTKSDLCRYTLAHNFSPPWSRRHGKIKTSLAN